MDAAFESSSSQTDKPSALWRIGVVAVLTFAAILFTARLGERALWSEEVRWAQIPREMRASGDWLWPTINGRSYYDKPLGSYWLVLLAAWLTGAPDEVAVRLPSAGSALAAVLFTMLIARRLHGEQAGILSGLILTTSFAIVFFARTASADMENVAGILVSLWIFLRNEERPAGWWTLLFWLVMALTSLTKGLLGFAVPILLAGIYASLAAQPANASWRIRLASILSSNRWLFNRVSLAAIPLAVGLYAIPFVASALVHPSTDGLAMVYRENLRRFFDPVNHRGPIYLYGYAIFLLLAPWSALLPAALVHAHGGDSADRRGRLFTLVYFWGTFLFFTLSASRRSYYLLPILPACALLIARMLSGHDKPGVLANRLLIAGVFVIGLLVAMSSVAWLPAAALLPEPWDQIPALPAPFVFTATWLLCATAIGLALWRRQLQAIAWCFGLVASAFAVYFFLFALPAVEPFRTQKSFGDSVRQHVGADWNELGLWRTREIVYYLNPPAPLQEFHDIDELNYARLNRRVRWLIVRRRDEATVQSLGRIRVSEVVHAWESAEQAQTKLLLIELSDPQP